MIQEIARLCCWAPIDPNATLYNNYANYFDFKLVSPPNVQHRVLKYICNCASVPLYY